MKAVHCTRYGPPDVLQLVEVEKPTPGPQQVLVKNHTTAVTQSDIFIRDPSPLPFALRVPMSFVIGFRGPRKGIIGLTYAGEVEAVGARVSRFQPGDAVYGFTGFGLRAYAEYLAVSQGGAIAHKPKNLSFAEAVSLAYGGSLAWQYLEKGDVQNARSVLVYGASGSSGTLAVGLAKHFGAEVTGVCSARNLEMVKALGADHVLDYTTTDTVPDGARYDLVLDSVGEFKTSALKEHARTALTPNGRYVSIDDGDLDIDAARLQQLREFAEASVFDIIIDRHYPLSEIVEAHRYVGGGHKRGNVVIDVIPS